MRKSIDHYDHNTNTYYIQHIEDVEPIIDDVKAYSEASRNGFSKSGNWRKIGSIPLIVVEQVLREEGINLMGHQPHELKRAKRWLNENTKFRTVDRRV
jgi:hypothetical protein